MSQRLKTTFSSASLLVVMQQLTVSFLPLMLTQQQVLTNLASPLTLMPVLWMSQLL